MSPLRLEQFGNPSVDSMNIINSYDVVVLSA